MTAGGVEWRIGPYAVIRELGAGGMGRVVLARSPGGNEVAVKLLRPEFAQSAEYRQRFATEVAAARAVVGVFTAPVVDADPFGPEPWLATAYVPAPTLDAVVRANGAMDEAGLRTLAAGLAEALIAIHAAGVIHRDLKPGNILMSSDGPRVIDFGISKDLRFEDDQEAVPFGSVGYAAPEQVSLEEPVGYACDVFALGAVLVFAASARSPFGDASPEAFAYRVLNEEPDLSALPPSVRPTVAACMSRTAAQRPTPAAVLAALAPPEWDPDRTVGHTGPSRPDAGPEIETVTDAAGPATRAGDPPAVARRLTRRGFLAASGAAVTVGAGIGLAVALDSGGAKASGTAHATSAANAASDSPATPEAGGPTTGAVAALRPNGPAPAWATTVGTAPQEGSLSVIGGTVLWYPSTANNDEVLAFDASTGEQLWTGTSQVPSLAAQTVTFYGTVSGSTVYGVAENTGANESETYAIVGLDPAGRLTVHRPMTPSPENLFGVWGGVALISQLAPQSDTSSEVDGSVLTAISMADGAQLWSVNISASLYEQILVDSGTCYYLDSTTVYARDLHSGAEKWHVPATMGSLEGLSLAEGALILYDSGGPEIAGIGGPTFGMVALDPATGRQMWKNTQTSVITVRGPHVYVYSDLLPSLEATATKNSVQALDSATGRVLWTYDSPVSSALVVSIATGQNGGDTTWATDEFLIFPYAPGNDLVSTGEGGFLVLDARTGKLIWAHQGLPDAQDNQANWPAATSGTMVYAASATTLYAFEVSR